VTEQRRDISGGPRIVVGVRPNELWRCLLCGAAVVHVDDHYSWHLLQDKILAGLVMEAE
jgi:hypothetical protein